MTTNPLSAYLGVTGEKATAFAERVGVSRSYLSRLMAGEREADATFLADLEEATGGKVKPNEWVKWWRALPRSGGAAFESVGASQ
jgi:DNA-binding transcriptional regulator YdaS (Cro superfamily)